MPRPHSKLVGTTLGPRTCIEERGHTMCCEPIGGDAFKTSGPRDGAAFASGLVVSMGILRAGDGSVEIRAVVGPLTNSETTWEQHDYP